jgi:hypothetical protein
LLKLTRSAMAARSLSPHAMSAPAVV